MLKFPLSLVYSFLKQFQNSPEADPSAVHESYLNK